VGAKRAAEQEKFQDFNSGVDVILITTAASEAVNLQSASAMIFLDTPFSAGDLLQLYGRMLRIGSIHDRCYALHLVVPGTVDDHVMKIVNGKMDLIEKVLGKRLKGEEDEVFVLPENDISELFEALRGDAQRKARKYERVR
jgi:predicted helicase